MKKSAHLFLFSALMTFTSPLMVINYNIDTIEVFLNI